MVFVGGWFIYYCFPRKKSCFWKHQFVSPNSSPTGESRDAKIAPNSSLPVHPAVANDGYTIWLFNIAMENPHF